MVRGLLHHGEIEAGIDKCMGGGRGKRKEEEGGEGLVAGLRSFAGA